VIGATSFVAASTACAFAVSPEMLIACRLAQGAAAALLIPQGLGIIRDIFAPAERGSALALFGPVIGLSAVLGPIIGGALIAANAFGSTWRLIFFINLPLGLIAAIGAARLMPESHAPRRPDLDLVGTALTAVGMGLLVYPLIQGREAGWPAWTYFMVAGSVAAFGLMVAWSRRVRRNGRDPLIEASIFRHAHTKPRRSMASQAESLRAARPSPHHRARRQPSHSASDPATQQRRFSARPRPGAVTRVEV
jgi:MFS family permease